MSGNEVVGVSEEGDRGPCVLQLLGVVKVLVDWLLCLFAIPLWLMLVVTHTIVTNSGYAFKTITEHHSPNLYLYIAWIPKFLIAMSFIGVRNRNALLVHKWCLSVDSFRLI